jgi:uncharacterized protein YgiM (DUF1202 family)
MIYRIVLLGLMLFCPSTLVLAKEHFPFLGEISADKVSVRAGQNVNFERLDIVPQGTKVIVFEEQYGWYKIQLPATAKAYVRIDYLTIENDQIGRVSANRVNVRAGRGTNFSALGQLENGQYVRLVNKMDDWFQIVPLEGMRGWVSKDFVKFLSDKIPSLDSLGLVAVTASSIEETKSVVTEGVQFSNLAPVSVKGVIEPVPASQMLNNAAYQLTTSDGKTYYLQIDPAVIGKFTRDHVHVDGGLVPGVASLPYPVIAVRKFQLVL